MALNPHQKNKVDINSLNEEEQKLFRLYGKLPNKKDLLTKKLSERKYFDSGDYALSKAGKADTSALGGGLGREHPTPENIPHLSQTQSNSSSSGTPSGSTPPDGQRGSFSGPSGVGAPVLHPGTPGGSSGSPVKEASFLHRGMSVDELDTDPRAADSQVKDAEEQGVPIRQ
ncbi:unnamed protein product [Zymoseptoria tritici ST99CH_1A5]|uniref:mRNA stability protein n=1 Tax=Zymoseptoria tritici ST99CH_1A5 TaxID=1276529 RepID=A0A1Y6LY08_ZYMTR|nr:unnamed protein product [Zymoseptoria tritici ST99CH_1A5]